VRQGSPSLSIRRREVGSLLFLHQGIDRSASFVGHFVQGLADLPPAPGAVRKPSKPDIFGDGNDKRFHFCRMLVSPCAYALPQDDNRFLQEIFRIVRRPTITKNMGVHRSSAFLVQVDQTAVASPRLRR